MKEQMDSDLGGPTVRPGLCATCRHAKPVTSDRGRLFLMCRLSKTDTRLPKYPRLPVLECRGFAENRSGQIKNDDTPPASCDRASATTLLDDLMPLSDVAAAYSVVVRAPAAAVYGIVLRHSLLDSPLAKSLMALRALPRIISSLRRGRPLERFAMPTLGEMEQSAFLKLAEKPGEEIVLGLIGQFWKWQGGVVRLRSAEDFLGFMRAGFAKAAVNVRVVPLTAASSRLSTETRVRATEAPSRRKFLRYWRIIGPFSGLIRRDMLRRVKREAEAGASIRAH